MDLKWITNKIRIQFVDTDASERIHYSAIFRYFEIMDHNFGQWLSPYKKIIELGFDIPRVHVECSYLGEIGYDEMAQAQVSISKLGNSSYTLSFHFYKEDALVAKGSLTNVFIDRNTGKSVKIPESIRTELMKHLQPATAQ